MKLLVLGATRGVGSEIVRQAADRAHKVTAFVRAPERLAALRDRITVIQGDLMNRGALELVLEGQDVVLSGFFPRLPISKGYRNLLGNFARVLTRAMVATRIQRAVVAPTPAHRRTGTGATVPVRGTCHCSVSRSRGPTLPIS